jgi:Protein of unknown function (DUF3352)
LARPIRVGAVRALAFVASVATACVVAVGCGGGGGGGGGGLAGGADLVPASAVFFAALNTDFEGDQWGAAENLIRRFPSGPDALAQLQTSLRDDEVDFERDVKPAVGEEVNVVVLSFDDPDSAVVLTQPRDTAKWQELVTSGDEPGVTEELEDGWWIAAQTQEAIDAFKAARGDDSLADNDAFSDAMDQLPGDSLASLYVSGDALTQQVEADGSLDEQGRAALSCLLGEARIPSMAFALGAEEDGARVSGAFRAGELEQPDEAGSDLSGEFPAGALAVFSVNNLAEQARIFLRCASEQDEEFSQQLGQAELALGLNVEEDILPHFEGETAVAVYPAAEAQAAAQDGSGLGEPLVVVATEVDDEDRAREVADQLAQLASMSGGDATVEDVEIAGVQAKRVTSGDTEVVYAVFDGLLVAASGDDGITRMREDGDRLEDDDAFSSVREAADAPGETAGFTYANVEQAVDLALSFAGAFGGDVDEQAIENLEPLRSVFFWGEVDGDVLGFEGFLQID